MKRVEYHAAPRVHRRQTLRRPGHGGAARRVTGRLVAGGQTAASRSGRTGTAAPVPNRRGWPSRSPVPPRCGPSRSRGGFMSCSAPDQFGRRAAVRAQLVPARSRSSPWTSRTGSRASRCESIPGRTASPARSTSSKPGRYAIQAVVRLNPDTHKIGDGEGNAYGPVVHAELDPKKGGTVALKVDQIVSSPGHSRRPTGSSWSSCPARSSRLFITGRSSIARR